MEKWGKLWITLWIMGRKSVDKQGGRIRRKFWILRGKDEDGIELRRMDRIFGEKEGEGEK